MSGRVSHVLNPRKQEHWAGGVGSFILNFGAIEAETYFWIRRLRTNLEPVKRAHGRSFARRVAIVRELLEAIDGDEGLKTLAAAAWDEALDLATFRNRIAHGPLLLMRRDGSEEGERHVMGVLDFKTARGEELQIVDRIDKARLNKAIDDAAFTAQWLRDLIELIAPAQV